MGLLQFKLYAYSGSGQKRPEPAGSGHCSETRVLDTTEQGENTKEYVQSLSLVVDIARVLVVHDSYRGSRVYKPSINEPPPLCGNSGHLEKIYDNSAPLSLVRGYWIRAELSL